MTGTEVEIGVETTVVCDGDTPDPDEVAEVDNVASEVLAVVSRDALSGADAVVNREELSEIDAVLDRDELSDNNEADAEAVVATPMGTEVLAGKAEVEKLTVAEAVSGTEVKTSVAADDCVLLESDEVTPALPVLLSAGDEVVRVEEALSSEETLAVDVAEM